MEIRQLRHVLDVLVSSFFVFLVVLAVFYFQNQFAPMIAEGQQGSSAKSLSGDAWSSNIGWIKFKGIWSNPVTGTSGDYGVTLSSDNKYFRNYAWSSNIGWIRFDPSTAFASGDGWPTGTTNPHGGQLESDGTTITGWARACSVFQSGCSGDLKGPSYLGGWDGWVSLNCSNITNSCTTSNYGVTYNSSGQLTNFAWGDTNVGWVSFCPKVDLAGDTSGACVTIDSLGVSCTAADANGDGRFDVGENVTWTALVTSGGVAPYNYTYCWGTNCPSPPAPPGGIGGDVNSDANPVTITGGYSAGSFTANVRATQDNKSGDGTCSIVVVSQTTPALTVTVVDSGGTGFVDANPNGTNNSIDGCQSSNSSCVDYYSYSPPTSVILTAVPDLASNPNTISSWVGCDSVLVNDCSVTMSVNEPKFVTVTFEDNTVTPGTVTLTAIPPRLEINSQSEGSPAETVRATITAVSSGDLSNAQLCVGSFNSAVSGLSIDEIITNFNDKFECRLNGQDSSNKNCGVSGQTHCVFLRNESETYKATFQVNVPTKLTSIPKTYLVKLFVQGFTGDITIPFIYRPGSGGP